MTTDDEIKCLSQIAAGLLASGQFTKPDPDSDGDEITLKSWDRGKAWKEDGALCRYELQVIDCAESVFGQIKENAERSAVEEKESKWHKDS